MKRLLLPFLAAFVFPTAAIADTYTKEWTRCVLSNSSLEDKITFVKLVARAQSEHPDLKDLYNISDKEKLALDKKIGAIWTKFLQDTCNKEAKDVIKYEGPEKLPIGIGALADNSSRIISSHPSVKKASGNFNIFIDTKGLGL